MRTQLWTPLGLALAAALAAGALPASIPGAMAAEGATVPARCAADVVESAAPVGEALDAAAEPARVRAAVRDANDLSRRQLRGLAADPTAWVDACGAVFYVEEEASAGSTSTTQPAYAEAVPADVLTLESRPGATRTIHLDFTGHVVTGTVWNKDYGQDPIGAPAFSITAPADTNFTATERAAVYTAWRTVAEDYAPFDVNVTTREPAPGDLTRSSLADPTYGVRVLVTAGGAIYNECGCGGVAYLGTFSAIAVDYYMPAWVFTDGSGTDGYNIAQAASHEAGHALNLYHDATSTAPYYGGAEEWGPLMGASYDQRVSQWSAGEYPDADNQEDDLALIAEHLDPVPDDHGQTPLGATPLTTAAPTNGLIGTRDDKDAFSFVATGTVTISVVGAPDVGNADLQLRILDDVGQQVALVDPKDWMGTALGALWRGDLPVGSGAYTAEVDGVGFGSPATPGQYSDYGSLGRYTVTMSTQETVDPPTDPTLDPTTDPVVDPPTDPTDPTTDPTVDPTVEPTPDPTTDPTTTATPVTTVDATPVTTVGSTPYTVALAFVTGRHLPKARVGQRYATSIRVTATGSALRWVVKGLRRTGLTVKVRGTRVRVVGVPRRTGRLRLETIVRSSTGSRVTRTFVLRTR